MASGSDDGQVMVIIVAVLALGVVAIRLVWMAIKGATKGIAKSVAKGIEEGRQEARREAQQPPPPTEPNGKQTPMKWNDD